MLTPGHSMMRHGPVRGFSLIEMMVSIVIGMIVALGAVSLIVAIDRSNSETIQSTRLNQELRSIAAVISNDLKRARRIDDPIAKVGQGTNACANTAPEPCFGIGPAPTADPECITYGYSGTSGSTNTKNFRAIRRAVDASGIGSIVLAADTSAVDCTSAGTQLNSAQVDITGLCLAYNTGTVSGGNVVGTTCPVCTSSSCLCTGGAAAVPAVGTEEVDVCIAGRLRTGDTYTQTITRSILQPVFIRSISVN
jgi:Tfp pilus assembly protein PilW